MTQPPQTTSISVVSGTFERNAAGDRIVLPANSTLWTLRPITVGQKFEITTGTNADKVLTVASISADGLTLILREANTVLIPAGGASENFEIVTETPPRRPSAVWSSAGSTRSTSRAAS